MSYTLNFGIGLGASHSGLILEGQFVDNNGDDYGLATAVGFSEIGNGNYLWSTTMDDNFQGGVKIYESGVSTDVLAFSSINSIEVIKDIGYFVI